MTASAAHIRCQSQVIANGDALVVDRDIGDWRADADAEAVAQYALNGKAGESNFDCRSNGRIVIAWRLIVEESGESVAHKRLHIAEEISDKALEQSAAKAVAAVGVGAEAGEADVDASELCDVDSGAIGGGPPEVEVAAENGGVRGDVDVTAKFDNAGAQRHSLQDDFGLHVAHTGAACVGTQSEPGHCGRWCIAAVGGVDGDVRGETSDHAKVFEVVDDQSAGWEK